MAIYFVDLVNSSFFNNLINNIMKFFLLIIILCFQFGSKAQTWCTPNSVWYYNLQCSDGTCSGYFKHTYLYDTIVNTKTYNKIATAMHSYGGPMGPQHYYSYLYTLVENNVVYFNAQTPSQPSLAVDTLIYFGSVGAKWRTMPTADVSCSKSTIEILNTGTSTIQSQNLNWWEVKCTNYSAGAPMPIITTDTIFERVGYKKIAYQIPGYCFDGTDAGPRYFRCFSDNQLSISTTTLNCDYVTSVNTYPDLNSEITLYPNPTTGIVTINIDSQNLNTIFEVHDVLGNLVSRECLSFKTQTFSISKLSAGIYTYKVLNGKSIIKTGQLIKE